MLSIFAYDCRFFTALKSLNEIAATKICRKASRKQCRSDLRLQRHKSPGREELQFTMSNDLLHRILLGKLNCMRECGLKIHNLLEAVLKHDKHIKKGIEICCSFSIHTFVEFPPIFLAFMNI